MQLVDKAGAKIRTAGLDAPADLHVAISGSESRPIQRRLDTLGHEDEGGAAFHFDRIARVMRQHEGRRVVGRIVAPPALPALVRPGTADRPEHVAAEDEGAEPLHRAMGVGFVDPIGTAGLPEHCPEGPGAEEPLMQLEAALAERVRQALLRAGAEPIEREREARDTYL